MMTYSQPQSSYYYDNHSSSLPKNKLSEQRYYGSPSSTSSHGSYSMTGSTAHPRTLPPYISVHRPSEPASPATVATTISSHSTPSPSPSRNSHIPNTVPTADFTLFDDAIIAAAAQDLNNTVGKGRAAIDPSTTMADTSAMSNYATSGFPLIVHHDNAYSNYTPSSLYGNYSSNYSAPDNATGLYNLNAEQQPLQQSQQQKYLRPASYNGNDASMTNSYTHHPAGEVESIENVPALSPTSRQRNTPSPARSKASNRPKSPLSQGASTNDQVRPNYAQSSSAAYLHSAIPKLGRTFSDAVQDELYNPDLIYGEQKQQRNQNKSTAYPSVQIKSENKSALPRIFQEAQQQHQQDYSQLGSSQPHIARDRSPFRNNSPYHPTNNSFDVSYGSNGSLSQNQMPQGFNQNQLAMAMALREQMRKEAEQATVAPKTISPRDAILEYHEQPDNQSNQMSLFPPLPNGRMLPPQEDAMSSGSMHTASQDGSDMDDYHSMATSRRPSMATSSVSSHLDVPRFTYMPQSQSSYDNMTATQYYYNDAHPLTNNMPMNDVSSVPYIKEEMDYAPIQRPADVSAGSGTYTCTFSGCGQRFTTSTKLQKHRREAHRKAVPMGNSVSTAAAIASRNAQPGPHRCMRVNPSTGKPCNTVFSRPYDLTRHEDTIHNSAKEKVRCEICNDEKTFSRPDALVRHRRVKHGIH